MVFALLAAGPGRAYAADTSSSKAMRDYYKSLKGTAAGPEREAQVKKSYHDTLGPAVAGQFKKNQDEANRRRPPGKLPLKKASGLSREEHRKLNQQKRLAEKKGGKGKPSAPGDHRAPVGSGSYTPPREQVVIDGSNVPKEIEFSGKKPSGPSH